MAKPCYNLKSSLFPAVNAEERPALQGAGGRERWPVPASPGAAPAGNGSPRGLLSDYPAMFCPVGRLSAVLLRPGMANPAFLNFKSPARSCPFDSGCVTKKSLGELRFLGGQENEGGPGE